MKPVIPLTKSHVLHFIRYRAEHHGKSPDSKLPRGLVDACIREGSVAAEAAIVRIVDDAFGPIEAVDHAPVAHHSGETTELVAPTADVLPLVLETPPTCEPLPVSEVLATLEALKTPPEPCIVAKAIEIAAEVIATIAPLEIVENIPDAPPFDVADEGFETVFDDSITPLDGFISAHKLRIIPAKSPTGEWYCVAPNIGDDVLNSKVAAVAAMRQNMICMGDCKASAVEAYAKANGLAIEA